MTSLEKSSYKLYGNYKTRPDAVNKCFTVARERGIKIFAIHRGGMCLASNDLNRYKTFGKANDCRDSKGAYSAKDVYLILQPQCNIHK